VTEPVADAPLRHVGLYRLDEPLGRGGMGTVHRGVHTVTGAMVAIKTVQPTSSGLLASLRREIHALAQLRHPGIVRIIEDGVQEGLPWYAMEIVPGLTLRRYLTTQDDATHAIHDEDNLSTVEETHPDGVGWWTDQADQSGVWGRSSSGIIVPPPEILSQGPLPTWDLHKGLAVARRLCDVLAFLHGEGIVHRDLKPSNIIVRDDGSPVLVDFGLAARFRTRESLDTPYSATGTAAYIAPEQASGELVDARADLYSLGCILYEIVTGRVPFVGENAAVLRYQHTSLDPVAPSQLTDRADALPGLEALIMTLLAKDPRARLGHAADVASALETIGAPHPESDTLPQARSYLYRPAFVGRAHELKDLAARLEELENNVGSAAFVIGESGVGKTRLLLELCSDARRRGVRVFACQCPSPSDPDVAASTRSRPLEPLRPLLQMVADQCRRGENKELEDLLKEQAQLLALYEPSLVDVTGPLMLAGTVSPQQARHRLYASVEQTLTVLTRKRPALLAIDDLQWADELTLGFVRYLVQTGHGKRLPVLLIATWRSEEAPQSLREIDASGIHTMQIERLSEREVRSMVADMLALSDPPASLVSFLARQSEGNPFFVGEYLQAALDERILRRDQHGRWRAPELTNPKAEPLAALSLPRGMKELIGRRLDDLSHHGRRLLTAAAVVGRVSHVSLLEAVTALQPDEFLDAIQEVIRRQFMEHWDAERIAFKHAKIREVAYARLSQEYRVALHRSVAETLEERPDKRHAALGRHWEQAGDIKRAVRCYLTAARATAERYAGEEAERLYRTTLKMLGKTAEAATVRLELVQRVLLAMGETDEALTEAKAALAEAEAGDAQPTVARALHLLAVAHEEAGNYREGMEYASRAQALHAELGDTVAAAEMLEHLSICASRL